MPPRLTRAAALALLLATPALTIPALTIPALTNPALAVPPPTPDDPEAAEGARLIMDGRDSLGVPLILAALDRAPGNPDLLTYLALAQRRSGRAAEAEASYALALAADPDHLAALAYQGVLYLDTGRRAQAEANLARLTTLCPGWCAERDDLQRELARPR